MGAAAERIDGDKLTLPEFAGPPLASGVHVRYTQRMQSKATSVKEYLASLPEDRREALQVVRKVILDNLDEKFEEGMQYGMIGYYLPHSVYPAGYHCDPSQPLPFAALASQKGHMSIYLMCIYGSREQEGWFRQAWAKTGKKLDMGKSCVRFKKVDDLALDVLGKAIKQVTASTYLAHYESSLKSTARAKASGSGTAKPSKTAKKTSAAIKKTGKKTTRRTAKKTSK